MRRMIVPALAILTLALLQRARADWFGRHKTRPSSSSCPGRTAVPEVVPEVLPEAAPEEAPDQAVRRVLNDQVVAWNRGDLEGFMAGYCNSPDLSFFSGKERTAGWQATLDRYVKKYRSEGREMGKLTFSDLEVDVLGPGAVLARGRWQLKQSKDELGGLFTLVFRRFPDGWRIVHDHTSG